MKSLYLKSYGKNIRKKLFFLETETPKPEADEVLIEIHAAGLNPVDYKIVHGVAKIFWNPAKPFALGFDLAGIIIGKGDAVNNFQIGDEVYAKVTWPQMGTISTHLAVKADAIALKPKSMTFVEAASIPLAACTVIQSFDVAGILKGTRVLIHAGSGGIGTFAIQYAKLMGAYVYTTTSTDNVDLVKSLGADCVIDYKKEDYRQLVKEVDVVYDTLGGRFTRDALQVVKTGGKIISIAGHIDDETTAWLKIPKFYQTLNSWMGRRLMKAMRSKNVFYKHVWMFQDQELLAKIAKLIEAGKIRAVIDREYNFEDAIEALVYLQTNRAKGKVVVRVKN